MIYAPIIIPTLNRDEHLKRLLDSLALNGWAIYTDVYIAVDYPPSDKYVEGYHRVCDLLDHFDGSTFNSFNVVKRDFNLGVGVNGHELIEALIKPRYDRWIYSEDDLEFSPNFIEYMDKCLDRFADDDGVYSVCGYSYPLNWNLSEGSTVFMTQATYSAWGTGQWRDKHQEGRDAIVHQHYLFSNADRAFKSGIVDAMIPGRKSEYVSYVMLGACEREMETATDMAFGPYLLLSDKKVIVPAVSKVRNLGFDGSGVNCSSIDSFTGKHSLDYDYSSQPIDQSATFELSIDESPDHIAANHRLIGNYLYVSPRLQLSEFIGLLLYKVFGLKGRSLGRFFYLNIRNIYKRIKH